MKTAIELGIPEWVWRALQEVKRGLEDGTLVHIVGSSTTDRKLFDMAVIAKESKTCGTVACIGGWVYALGMGARGGWTIHADAFVGSVREDYGDNLGDLFIPPSPWGYGRDYDEITPAQAALAIGNYLEHGEPRWDYTTAGAP